MFQTFQGEIQRPDWGSWYNHRNEEQCSKCKNLTEYWIYANFSADQAITRYWHGPVNSMKSLQIPISVHTSDDLLRKKSSTFDRVQYNLIKILYFIIISSLIWFHHWNTNGSPKSFYMKFVFFEEQIIQSFKFSVNLYIKISTWNVQCQERSVFWKLCLKRLVPLFFW